MKVLTRAMRNSPAPNPGVRKGRVRFRARACLHILMLLFLRGVRLGGSAHASDHLDSPATGANPQADIADVYAWTSSEGRQLNLAMTIQGHSFSDKIEYALHVDSGKVFGHTTASTVIVCRFAAANAVRCQLGNADSASGDPTDPVGLEGRNHRFRVYAALRDDPFYNNIKGLLGAYQTANAAIKNGAPVDAAGCAHFDAATTDTIRDQMGHTDGEPGAEPAQELDGFGHRRFRRRERRLEGRQAAGGVGRDLRGRSAGRSHGPAVRWKHLARRRPVLERRREWHRPPEIQRGDSSEGNPLHRGSAEVARIRGLAGWQMRKSGARRTQGRGIALSGVGQGLCGRSTLDQQCV